MSNTQNTAIVLCSVYRRIPQDNLVFKANLKLVKLIAHQQHKIFTTSLDFPQFNGSNYTKIHLAVYSK